MSPQIEMFTDNRFQIIVSDIDSIESEMLEQHPEIRKLLDQYRKTERMVCPMTTDFAGLPPTGVIYCAV